MKTIKLLLTILLLALSLTSFTQTRNKDYILPYYIMDENKWKISPDQEIKVIPLPNNGGDIFLMTLIPDFLAAGIQYGHYWKNDLLLLSFNKGEAHFSIDNKILYLDNTKVTFTYGRFITKNGFLTVSINRNIFENPNGFRYKISNAALEPYTASLGCGIIINRFTSTLSYDIIQNTSLIGIGINIINK